MANKPHPSPAEKAIGHFSPKLVSLTDDILFGDVWERSALSKRDRSLATISALIAQPWIVPIPGTTKLDRLEENIAAAELELTAENLREIESAAIKITVQGARYPEPLEALTGR
jgi:hypothetical protein